MDIKTEKQLRFFLKIYKRKAMEKGLNEFDLYPNFVISYDKDREKFHLPKELVFETALDVFLENNK